MRCGSSLRTGSSVFSASSLLSTSSTSSSISGGCIMFSSSKSSLGFSSSGMSSSAVILPLAAAVLVFGLLDVLRQSRLGNHLPFQFLVRCCSQMS